MEPKEEAFVSRKCPEIFHSIEHTNDIWLPDPFDVPFIHTEARDTFAHLVEQALVGDIQSGRILVIRGEAGSGKTHLMRAFRNTVHEDGSAFFAYMQMTTSSQNYERYMLQNLIDSLQQPYRALERKTSLQVLSDRLVENLPQKRVRELRESHSGIEAAPIVNELADRLIDRNDLPPVDPDLVRALLFLQVESPSVTTKVNKYLRAESLSEYDRNALGGIATLHADDAPLRHVMNLAKLIRAPLNRALVVCVDQLEDMFNLDASRERFPRAMSAVTSIAELPSVVVVVSCLEQFYVQVKQHLSSSTVHRLEQDPQPMVLSGMRTREEARAMIAQRLGRLWEECDLPAESHSIAPFPDGFLDQVERQQTRAILAECLKFRMRAIEHGTIPPLERTPSVQPPPPEPENIGLIQAWNDLRTAPQEVPEEESERRDLLRDVLLLASGELGADEPLTVTVPKESNALVLEAPWLKAVHVAVTESSSRGGGLLRQMESAQKASSGRTLVLVRSDAFAKTAKSNTMSLLGKIVAKGGRGVVVSDADWRHFVAFRRFHADHRNAAGYSHFRRSERPLFSLKAIQDIYDGSALENALQAARAARSPEPSTFPAAQLDREQTGHATPERGHSGSNFAATESLAASLDLGVTHGTRTVPVIVDPQDMKRHAAFLGSTGSGKTTAAMMVIEQLLARKLPAILIDRKGDLCGYGLPEVWTSALDDPERASLRARLHSSIDVELYTPGAPRGRNLTVPLVTNDLRDLSQEERESMARTAGDGLAAMMSYGSSQAHQGSKVAIAKAINYLASAGEVPRLESISELLANPEDEFVADLGTLAKFCERAVIDLDILRANKAVLLGGDGEVLDIERFLRPRPDGRVPLTIISTKFLSSESDVQFWVAQLLVHLNRWLDKHPSSALQGVIMLDEADLYLPATRTPVSKKPVEDLLRRARSKGLGVFLATQSPGDLDYKCRDNIVTWLVGLVAQETALKKLEPMFRDTHLDLNRLASQKVGEFHLIKEGNVRSVKTRMNAVPLPSQVPDEEILRLAREKRP